jgi:hypothetical protein
MPNSLTLHFHLKHFKESGLPFSEYMLLLLYEEKQDWRVAELVENMKLSDRTIIRMRGCLIKRKYLKNNDEYRFEYFVTEKFRQNESARI